MPCRASSRSTSLQGIVMLLRQIEEGRAEVENQYTRVVPWEGNRAALARDGRGLRAASLLRVARAGVHLAIGAAPPRQLCRVGCRAPLLDSLDPSHGSKGRAVRGSAEGRAQACAVQAVRPRVHARTSGRRPDGLVGRLVRRLLQLRASEDRGRREALPAVQDQPCHVASRIRRSRWPTAPAARPAAA